MHSGDRHKLVELLISHGIALPLVYWLNKCTLTVVLHNSPVSSFDRISVAVETLTVAPAQDMEENLR